jgi:GNAT superfamily N-acetyltransferase
MICQGENVSRSEISPSTITIHEATTDNPLLVEALTRLFVEIFPEDCRYTGYIRDCARRALEDDPLAVIHQWVVEYQGEYIGLRLFNYLRQRNFGFTRYVGLLPAYHRLGIGRWIHQKAIEQIKADAAAQGQPTPIGFCGELDHPAAAPDDRERRIREQRVEIFHRMGVIVLDIDYFEPPMIQGMRVDDGQTLVGVEPEPMLFCLTPFRPITQPSPEQIAELVVGVLVDNYRLSEDSWYVRRVLASIRQPGSELSGE